MVVAARQYDAWGNLQAGASEPGYAFTGREWDSETGLYYYRARYRDPRVGNFISEDPIGRAGGDLNFYAYAMQNPVTLDDPTGLYARYVPPSPPLPVCKPRKMCDPVVCAFRDRSDDVYRQRGLYGSPFYIVYKRTLDCKEDIYIILPELLYDLPDCGGPMGIHWFNDCPKCG